MGSLKLLAIAGAMATVTASAAIAGDLPAPVAIPDAPAEVSTGGDGSGLYLRGDVGVGITGLDGFSQDPPVVGADQVFVNAPSLSESYFIGAGVGYAYNSWLRFDATGEYRAGMRLHARDELQVGGVAVQSNQYTGNLSSAVGMVNAYIDLGTFCELGCITPYVGGGVGVAYHWLSDFADQGLVGLGGAVGPAAGYAPDSTSTEFAWALMAGVAYQVNERLTLDLGYRYINLGDGPSSVVTNVDPALAGTSYTNNVNSIDSHDIRIGMRWTLGSGDCCGGPAEAPLTRKY
jgi:opacity protein-like surface antigen